MTNREFSKQDEVFRKACEISGTPPTARQASKYHRKTGLAVRCKGTAAAAIKREQKAKEE